MQAHGFAALHMQKVLAVYNLFFRALRGEILASIDLFDFCFTDDSWIAGGQHFVFLA